MTLLCLLAAIVLVIVLALVVLGALAYVIATEADGRG